MPKLNSLEVVHQDTNKDSYQNLHDIIISLKGSQNQEIVDKEARALYETLLELYTNDKEAVAKRIEKLIAEFKDSDARIIEELYAYASASEAYAKKISSVSAEVANASASVISETYARVTADEALAGQITTTQATIGSKTRTYLQTTAPSGSESVPLVDGDLWFDTDDNFKLYRYNGSSWAEVADSRIAANTAAISAEQGARVAADSALAFDIDALTARLDTGDFADVKVSAEASAQRLTTRINLTTEITNWNLYGGLALNTGTTWGLTALGTGTGTYVASSPYFPVDPGATYTITGDSLNLNSSGNVLFQIVFYDAGGNALKTGASNPIYGSHGFDTGDLNRNQHAVADTAPSGATQARARFVVTDATGSLVGFRQVKVELGGLPATNFSQETTVNYTSAKWGVTVNANNQVAGISLLADSTGTSEFVVAANKFRVKKPDNTDGISWNGTNSRLDISGDIYATSFTGNVINTGNINNNAVTSVNSADGIYSAVVSFTTTETSPVYILGVFTQGSGRNGQPVGLYLDGVQQTSEQPQEGTVASMARIVNVPAGSHTASIGAYSNIGDMRCNVLVIVCKR